MVLFGVDVRKTIIMTHQDAFVTSRLQFFLRPSHKFNDPPHRRRSDEGSSVIGPSLARNELQGACKAASNHSKGPLLEESGGVKQGTHSEGASWELSGPGRFFMTLPSRSPGQARVAPEAGEQKCCFGADSGATLEVVVSRKHGEIGSLLLS